MKKKLLFVVVTVLALASCSSDETVAVKQDSPISFRAYTTGLTRAADASLANGSSFKVTAFQTGGTATSYFTNVVFTANSGTTFSSANKYYWPESDGKLDFYAWAPSTFVAATNNYNGFEITPGTTIGSQPDFIYAVSKGWGKTTRNGAAGVSLNFRHAESKVIIMLQNTNNNLKITVGDVTIGNLRGTETFTWYQCTDGASPTPTTADNTDGNSSGSYMDGTWTATSAQTSTYTVTMESTAAANPTDPAYNELDGTTAAKGLTSTASDYEMILIPQVLNNQTTYSAAATSSPFNGAYISVELKIQNKADGDNYLAGGASSYVKAMWPLGGLTWLPGHKYTYIVDLAGGGYYTTNQDADDNLDPILQSGSEIKFLDPTIDTWITDLDGNTLADDDIDVAM